MQYKSHSLPVNYILMSTKSGTLYGKVVAKVIEFISMIVTITKSDEESTLYSSLQKVFSM